jgi:hypothetical protein
MPYVMMPVPEEHVEEVMQFVLRAVERAKLTPWDEESLNKVYGDVDEASRSLLAFVAREAATGSELDATDATHKMQLTAREVIGIMNELITLSRTQNRPNLLNSRIITERLPNGRTHDRRTFLMEPEIADLVRAAERAEVAEVPQPLGGVTE